MTGPGAQPLISIIVPVYNVEDYLAECLESLILQTYRAIEVVCVDDGSSDSSPLILQSYAAEDDRIRVITQENGGVSHARNRGLEAARGDYVMFVDSDDFIALNTCEVLLRAAQRDGADIVVFGGKTFPTVPWKDDSFARRDTVYHAGKTVDALVFEPGSRPLMCNKMYARPLLDSCGARFNESISLGEDHAFQFYVFPHAKTVSYVGDILYYYRSRDESLVSQADEDFDEKSRKHMVLVEHIVSIWRDMGMLAERPNDLLSWISDFLFDSMRFTSFDVRSELSAALRDLLDGGFDERTIGFLDDTVRRKLDFMLESCVAADQPPLMTFAFASLMGETLSSEALQSVLWQDEQRIECVVSSECATDEVRAIAGRDRRCRIEALSTMGQLAGACSGNYVIVASCNCLYDSHTASDVLDYLDYQGLCERMNGNVDDGWRTSTPRGSCPADMDVLVFRDRAGSIRCEDAFADCSPNNARPLRGAAVLPFDDIRARGFCALSLALGNKAFRVGFLVQGIEGEAGFADAPLSAWAAAVSGRAFTVMSMAAPLVEFGEMSFCPREPNGGDAGERLRAHLESLCLAGDDLDGEMRPGFFAALSQYCLSLDDALRDYGFYAQAHEPLAACMGSCMARLGQMRASLEAADDEQSRSLLSDDAFVHYGLKTRLFLERVRTIDAALLFEMNQLRDENKRLASRIGLFYKSASYRVGQVVTMPARKLYYRVKALRNK